MEEIYKQLEEVLLKINNKDNLLIMDLKREKKEVQLKIVFLALEMEEAIDFILVVQVTH